MTIGQNDSHLRVGARVIATRRSTNTNNPGYDIGDTGVVAATSHGSYVYVDWNNGQRHWHTLLENIRFLSSDSADQLFS